MTVSFGQYKCSSEDIIMAGIHMRHYSVFILCSIQQVCPLVNFSALSQRLVKCLTSSLNNEQQACFCTVFRCLSWCHDVYETGMLLLCCTGLRSPMELPAKQLPSKYWAFSRCFSVFAKQTFIKACTVSMFIQPQHQLEICHLKIC